MLVLRVLAWALAAAALTATAYSLFAALAAAALAGRRAPLARGFPSVSILRPLAGAPASLEAALLSYATQDYPGEVQVVLGVHDADDPAVALAERVAPRLGKVEIVVDATMHGSNRKVSNLVNMVSHAKHEIIVLADADIIAAPDTLATLVAELMAPDVGAVTCLYRGEGEGIWATLSAMAIDYQFLPSVLAGVALRLARPCMGSTIALSRTMLDKVGGLPAFADALADDFEIGAAVRRAGGRVAVSSKLVLHVCDETSLAALVDHQVRWARTIRAIDGPGYAGSILTHPAVLALIACALLGFSGEGMGILAAAVMARFGVKFVVDGAARGRAGPWWLLPAADLLSFTTFLFGLTGDTVIWQGRRLRVGRAGVIQG